MSFSSTILNTQAMRKASRTATRSLKCLVLRPSARYSSPGGGRERDVERERDRRGERGEK